MHDRARSHESGRDWTSPLYAVAVAAALGLEWLLWRFAPYDADKVIAPFAFTLVLAAVPWIGSVNHRERTLALRRRGRWVWFALPAVVVHAGLFALFGPYWRSGETTSMNDLGDVLAALVDDGKMAGLLTDASRNERMRDLALLLRIGADPAVPDAEGKTALEEAASAQVVDALLAGGARVEPARMARAMYRLGERGDAAMLSRLLAAGADPNRVHEDMQGNTALHIAAYLDHGDAVRVLLAAGADPAQKNDNGEDAVAVARRGESRAALAELERVLPRR